MPVDFSGSGWHFGELLGGGDPENFGRRARNGSSFPFYHLTVVSHKETPSRVVQLEYWVMNGWRLSPFMPCCTTVHLPSSVTKNPWR
jgi:hypothetical protein